MFISEERLLKWAICSNAIYVILFFLFRPDGISFLKLSISVVLLFSIVCIYYLCIKHFNLFMHISIGKRLVIYFLILWGIVVVIRGFSTSIQDWITNLGNTYMGFAWLMPLMIVLGIKIENWNAMFKSISFMFSAMIFLIVLIPFLEINDEWIWLLRPVTFILLVGLYRFSAIGKIKALIILAFYIFVAIITGRRAEFLFVALVILFLLVDKLSMIQLRKPVFLYIIMSFLIVFVLIFTMGYQQISDLVSRVIEFQDSRTFLFSELFEDLSVSETIFGRGSLGTYYSEFMEVTKWYTEEILKEDWWGDSAIRITTEVGYLQMILKGGFILLILNLIVWVQASYLAIFKSNNKFIKRLGYFILILTILSIVEFRPAFTPFYFILWMAIGTVMKKTYREMDDMEIDALISFK